MFFAPPQQPSMFAGTPQMPQIPPQLQALIAQHVARARMASPQMPMGGMNPPNVPQQGLMPGQMPQMTQGNMINPLASILGNMGGATSPQGMNNGTGGGGNGGGGLMQIINAIKSQNQVNGAIPPGANNIMAIINAMKGG